MAQKYWIIDGFVLLPSVATSSLLLHSLRTNNRICFGALFFCDSYLQAGNGLIHPTAQGALLVILNCFLLSSYLLRD